MGNLLPEFTAFGEAETRLWKSLGYEIDVLGFCQEMNTEANLTAYKRNSPEPGMIMKHPSFMHL